MEQNKLLAKIVFNFFKVFISVFLQESEYRHHNFYLPEDNGTIYACVSDVYDFDGEVNGAARKGVSSNTFEADLGGAWLELGVDANFNWTKNTYISFERTNGGDVKENYRWNVGVRHNF